MGRKAVVLVVSICGFLAIHVVPALAGFEVRNFGSEFINQDGSPDLQAGSHPFAMVTEFNLSEKLGNGGEMVPDGNLKDVEVELPAGFVGNANAMPKCTARQFDTPSPTIFLSGASCPDNTQVGIGVVKTVGGGSFGINLGLYNLVPPPGVPAEFGFNAAGIPIILAPRVRSGGDYGLTVTVRNTSETLPIFGTKTTFWGVPAAHSHDEYRGECLGFLGFSNCSSEEGEPAMQPKPAGVNPTPLISLPTSCPGTVLTSTIHADSWQEPGSLDAEGAAVLSDPRWKQALPAESPPLTGCNRLDFSPTISISRESSSASSPSGLAVDLKMSALENPDGLAESNLKKAVVTLPQGMSVNPPSADGLGACSPEQIQIHSAASPSCPDAAKIGSVKIETPLLEDPLEGSVYLAQQNANPFNSLLALYVVAEADGVLIKLAGEVKADEQTAQLTATFDNNPQQPFTDLKLNFFGGPRAALSTPSTCGTYLSHATFYPWSGTASVQSEPSFTIDSNCGQAAKFTPTIEAGVTNPIAGSPSPFTFKLTREDGQQNVRTVSATLPNGELAKLAGVPYCPEAGVATASCPATSQIGTTTVAVGSGSNPLYIPQPGKAPTAIYLAGPYKGAPLSFLARVPAQAGPFDLGTVAVRTALRVDPETAQVTAVSDPLPQILQGIPIAYRTVFLNIDRADFMRNPTNCSPRAVTSSITSTGGSVATPSSPFQVTNCDALGFKPALKLSLKGSTKRAGHPALRAILTYPKGGASANIARAQVNLPHSEFIDQGNLNKTCTKPVLLAGKCPATSIYGRVKAWTPLLERPLEGPVYLVGGYGYKLPALVAELNGQIRVLLKGKIDTGPNKGIRNTFEAVPDAPVERFELNLKGGRKYSLLENSEDLCARTQKAQARFTGQNGKVESFSPTISNDCGKRGGGKK